MSRLYLLLIAVVLISTELLASMSLTFSEIRELESAEVHVGGSFVLGENVILPTCFAKTKLIRPNVDGKIEFLHLDSKSELPLPMDIMEFFYQNSIKTVYDLSDSSKKAIFISIEVSANLFAIDEGASNLHPDLRSLLNNKKYKQFFDHCGTHYIKSFNRAVSFMATIVYDAKGDPGDDAGYRDLLDHFLRVEDKKDREYLAQVVERVRKESRKRNLQIYLNTIGLSQEDKMFSPKDIIDFKRFYHRQLTLASTSNGQVTHVELQDWETSGFADQDLINKNIITQKRRRENLVLISLLQDRENILYDGYIKADQCRQSLNEYGRFENPNDILFVNHYNSTPRFNITLGVFRKYINDHAVNHYFANDVERFMALTVKCEIAHGENDYAKYDFDFYETCFIAQNFLHQRVPFLALIENYCPPILVKGDGPH